MKLWLLVRKAGLSVSSTPQLKQLCHSLHFPLPLWSATPTTQTTRLEYGTYVLQRSTSKPSLTPPLTNPSCPTLTKPSLTFMVVVGVGIGLNARFNATLQATTMLSVTVHNIKLHLSFFCELHRNPQSSS